MALGLFGSKEAKAADANSQSSEEQTKITQPEKSYDAEAGLGGARGADVRDSSDESFTIGKQIEMEADNAIKYRTCSWPKVCFCARGVAFGGFG